MARAAEHGPGAGEPQQKLTTQPPLPFPAAPRFAVKAMSGPSLLHSVFQSVQGLSIHAVGAGREAAEAWPNGVGAQ
ncbi:MAG: hypothetical protein JWR37_5398 [Mycobacterium sp.]|nr:hypothetical protein [Mycobacterium sp.]